MSEYIDFMINHWVLSSAFVFVVLLFCFSELKQQSMGIPKISINQMTNMINRQGAVVVDIREKKLYDGGHVVDALNLPLASLEKQAKLLNKYKSKPLVIMCLNGFQSARAALKLKSLGFEQISYLEGGVSAWKSENLPLVK